MGDLSLLGVSTLSSLQCLAGMRGIPVSEKYRGIKIDGIIYRELAKCRSIYYMVKRIGESTADNSHG